MTSALAVFETTISKVLNDGRVDDLEFTTLHLGVLSGQANVDHKIYKSPIAKSILEEINSLKKAVSVAS